MQFPKATLEFLEGIATHNEKSWFEANRSLYEAGYAAPARAFVADMGPHLRAISAEVQFDPKINGSIGRINRDIRFSNDKRPYKDHLDLWFWHGDRKGRNMPGFYVRITARTVWLGCGMHVLDKEQLTAFRDAVLAERSGKALVAAVAAVQKAGSGVGGRTRKQVPRGYDGTGPRADFLLYEGLYAHTELPAAAILEAGFAERCTTAFVAAWPIGRWLLDNVAS